MSDFSDKDIYKTGSPVEIGNYACTTCNGIEPTVVIISKDENKLPICPICGDTYWLKF